MFYCYFFVFVFFFDVFCVCVEFLFEAAKKQKNKQTKQQKQTNSIEFKRQSNLLENVLCPICVDGKRNFALVPCGHCFCEKCVNKFKSECPLCKKKIEQTFRVFFS